MKDLPDFIGMAEAMLAAAERGDMKESSRLKERFTNAGSQLTEDLLRQGYSMPEILSGAYLHDPKYKDKHQ